MRRREHVYNQAHCGNFDGFLSAKTVAKSKFRIFFSLSGRPFLKYACVIKSPLGRRPDRLFNRKIITIRKAAVANFATAASFWLLILIYRKLSLYGSSVNYFYYSFPASFLYLSSLSVFSSSASTKSFSASSGCAFFKVA